MSPITALKDLQPWFAWAPPWVFTLVLMLLALAAALIAHRVIVRLVRRGLRGGHQFWRPLLVRSEGPGRLALVVAFLSAALAASPLTREQTAFAQHAFAIAFVVLIGWIALIAVDLSAAVFLRRYRIDVDDNLLARKHATQIRILQRAASVLVVVVTVAMALMTINQVRQWGVSLLAAGGAAGILVGLALQPLLSNLLAGLQIAATQPIRLEDQLLVEGEVGHVEEINATYVVVKIWDERRMVLPLTYFLQKPFQNWTRDTARQMGTVMLYVDFITPVEPLRAKLVELLKATPLWDGRVCALQVTDAREKSLEIRCLMSAANSGQLFDLRCHVREAMVAFINQGFPEALLRDHPAPAVPPSWRVDGHPLAAARPQ
ncbi:MAG TPA: mechanosensitive ion channel domain-containing protein [Phenylobacterium sp.]|uniref:mechanosensitive ion channel family protein n=1 Tax=Phenylobacterium sp. TaxID=1871053 RepID=UPI002B45D817|nr:mechanosensitive ion channel domain-containing protein [Phenylobacterium sp.]HKR87571.1 mechanosensitive ion channel domain-containing protein [Phenylobacterium sp.]